MSSLVVTEAGPAGLEPGFAHALAAARLLAGQVSVLVYGAGAGAAAQAAARFDQLARVLACEHDSLAAEDAAQLIAPLARDHAHVLMADGTNCKQVLPRAAALADAPMLSSVTAIRSPQRFERQVYSGNLLATCRCERELIFLSIRTIAFERELGAANAAPIERLAPPPALGKSRRLALDVATSARPELGSADVVVAGGRGLGGAEGFAKLERLALRLNAAMGASRAACDAGWIDHSHQVGLTGKTITPDLYITVGISGASQHMAGCSASKNIVAINRDEDANIFKSATYGVVGDWNKILPSFIETVRELRDS